MSTNIFDKLEDLFPSSSHFIQIDNGWREINGERVNGWHVVIVGAAVNSDTMQAEGHAIHAADAIEAAINATHSPQPLKAG